MDTFDPTPFAAIVLAGGTGQRLGHVDKATVSVGGVSLLDRTVAACTRATQIVVVGPDRPALAKPWRQVRESPAGAGPAAALGAGVGALTGSVEVVLVVAVDMPFVGPGTVDRLVRSLTGSTADGAVLVGPDGRRQLALAVWRAAVEPLVADPAALVDAPLWRTLSGLSWVEVPAVGEEHHDIDTPEDLALARGPVDDGAGRSTP